MGRGQNQPKLQLPDKVPITLLCGFLGSGKTTLLKHILETKHSEDDFNCAVIVNDMAELNIDKALIDNTSLVQNDEDMIGMQNGCICCTLQTELGDQIVRLTQMKKFNYILIEASGVSEPHEIAPLFEVDDHEHEEDDVDHGHDHSKPQLGEVAKLDTCVTLIDSADFYNNLGSMKVYDNCEIIGTIPELMMDQVEFANVILLNKTDLVKEDQRKDIMEKIELLNPKAKVVKTLFSKVNVLDILNTGLYKNKEDFWVTSEHHENMAIEDNTVINKNTGKRVPEACTARFDIKSFVYRARKPFHPKRLTEQWLVPFFMDPIEEEEEIDVVDEDDQQKIDEILKKLDKQKKMEMEKLQTEALEKQKKRNSTMGELLRSKGFFWIATSNDLMGAWQQAGNVLRMKAENEWMCKNQDLWEGGPTEEIVRGHMQKESGEEYEYKDRRQEVVFIGHGMKREVIQKILDECLLTDEEMALGPEKWKETMEEFDNIKLELEDPEAEYAEFEEMLPHGDEDEDEEEDCQDEECEDNLCDKINEQHEEKIKEIKIKQDVKERLWKRKRNPFTEETMSEGVKRKKA